MFTLAISYLTTSNLPCFMDLTFQAPMQCHFLQHWSLLSPPDTSTTEQCFHFSPATSFFLDLLVIALRSSPVVCLHTFWPEGGSSSSVISFCLFILFIRFYLQEYWSDFGSPSLVDHILSELFTTTRPAWVAWLIALLSYASPLTTTRLWFVCEFSVMSDSLWPHGL